MINLNYTRKEEIEKKKIERINSKEITNGKAIYLILKLCFQSNELAKKKNNEKKKRKMQNKRDRKRNEIYFQR